MIIPIRCFTCGKVLGDKWEYYQKQVEALEAENNEEKVGRNFDNHAKGLILDKMGLKRMCCRRHMLCHVNLIDKI